MFNKGLQGVRGGDKGLQGVGRGYKGLQDVSKGSMGLQGVSKCYRELQGVTEYNNNNNKFIRYYHFVQVLPIKITIINS